MRRPSRNREWHESRISTLHGVVLKRTEELEEKKYPKLVGSSVLCLATAAHETGGRTPQQLQRWATYLQSCSQRQLELGGAGGLLCFRRRCNKTLATTLVDSGPAALDAADGGELAVTLDFYRLPMAFAIYDSTANLSR